MSEIRRIDESLAPILRDFETFINYFENNRVKLTSREQWIPPKILYELNTKMTGYVTPNPTLRTPQKFYVLLNFLYNLALDSKLFTKTKGKGGFYLEPTERLKLYKDLTSTERYFFLLETFWIDMDWELIAIDSRFKIDEIIGSLELFLMEDIFLKKSSKIKIPKWYEDIPFRISSIREIIFLVLCFYGLLNVKLSDTSADEYYRYQISISKASLTPLGALLFPILAKKRRIDLWNIPYRKKSLGELHPIPGSPLPGRSKRKTEASYVEEPFFAPFVELFQGELAKTLPRIKEEEKFVDGTYIFRVSLTNNKDIWRRIKVPADYTLDDLAYIILDAYNFDHDHLYSFFMDGKKWSSFAYTSPYDSEGPHADNVQIGELNLELKKRILFLYDYGDEWCFDVVLEKIDEKKIEKAKISERHGKSPPQYPIWED